MLQHRGWDTQPLLRMYFWYLENIACIVRVSAWAVQVLIELSAIYIIIDVKRRKKEKNPKENVKEGGNYFSRRFPVLLAQILSLLETFGERSTSKHVHSN